MKRKHRHLFIIGLVLPLLALAQEQGVRTGADLLLTKHFDLIKGKKLGLVLNHTAILSDGQHLVDALHKAKNVKVVALFGPEHGVRGDTTGPVESSVDPKTGIPIHSLYSATNKPTAQMLRGIDVLIYDIQDVGARFYTYISTLGHIMEAAAEQGIRVIVLDRPNPIGGLYVDGPVRDDTLKSFVAFAKIPIAYGMTIGELAQMYNGEGWLEPSVKADLHVVKMENWKRSMWYDQTQLPWIRPSPNMPTLATATVYTGTCLFEGVNISEGRGTKRPFEYIGAPWIDAVRVIQLLAKEPLHGVKFRPIQFTPTQAPQNARPPKYKGELCKGIFVIVKDRTVFEAVKTGIYLLWAIKKIHPEKMQWRLPGFDRLSGTSSVRTMLDTGKTPEEIFSAWKADLERFKSIRQRYLLYPR
ncbi:MAG: DUF1343 domain-containing protein [Ignavibacteria bacterium]|nr:DUF1343 domain-containing protein [Ignavibacteria bacterium]